jgi:hypothetical protein
MRGSLRYCTKRNSVTYKGSLALIAHYDESNKKEKSPERTRKWKAGIKMVGC